MERINRVFEKNQASYRQRIREQSPLVHCLTNHISITDCANIALALGARPIMAEHPAEAEEITQNADALVCNLGNITDERMQSILISGKTAKDRQIPVILDLVGVGCSSLRRKFSQECAGRFHPTVLKGNISEIKAFAGEESHASGIDAGTADQVTEETLGETCRWLAGLSRRFGSIIFVTGAYDLISDGTDTYIVSNGCKDMGRITGTGCMLSVVAAAFAGVLGNVPKETLVYALAYAAAMYGICGETALDGFYVGSGRVRLFDCVDQITDEDIKEKMKVERYEFS